MIFKLLISITVFKLLISNGVCNPNSSLFPRDSSKKNAYKPDTTKGNKKLLTFYFTESIAAPYNIWAQNGWMNASKPPLGGCGQPDTGLHNFEIFIDHYNLGNTGLPYVPVLFDNSLQPMGFYYANDYISNNFYSDSTVKYFNTRAPYTQFYYVTDPEIHQFFQLTHAENIGNNFDFCILFKRIRSEGDYLNQATNENQLLVSSNYHIKRYAIFIDGIYTNNNFQQNGGIPADSFLSSPNYTQRTTVPVNLNYASTTINELSFHFKQYYYFGQVNDKRYGMSDKDSALPLTPYPLPLTLFYISHSFRISSHSNIYNDDDSADDGFYKTFYHDSLTYDSIRYTEITNDLSIGTARGWSGFLRWEAGITQQHIHFENFTDIPIGDGNYAIEKLTDTVFNNYIAHVRLYNAYPLTPEGGKGAGKLIVDLSGQYIFAGNLQGNEQVIAMLGYKLDSLRFLKLTGTYSSQAPPFLYDLYQGDNFDWVNHLQNVNTSSLGLNYRDFKWRFEVNLQATQISNMVYFDTLAQPMQYNPAINVYCASVTKDFKLLWHFHLKLSYKYQYVEDNLPLRLPRIVAEHSFYWENYLFKHALLIRVGADICYNTAYYGYAYMPVFDQYYLENSSKLGNYTYIDPFVSFRIKTFRMFVKYENATAGYFSYNYYYALHYPMPDATLRFGISWDFWN